MSFTQWLTVLPAVVCCLRGGDLKAASPSPAPYGQQVVAAVLMGEAWGEGEAAMTAVAEVIRRRADLKGISPLAVVVQPKQFTCLNRCSPEDLVPSFPERTRFPEGPAHRPSPLQPAQHAARPFARRDAFRTRGHPGPLDPRTPTRRPRRAIGVLPDHGLRNRRGRDVSGHRGLRIAIRGRHGGGLLPRQFDLRVQPPPGGPPRRTGDRLFPPAASGF
jgi:hypothetical protein